MRSAVQGRTALSVHGGTRRCGDTRFRTSTGTRSRTSFRGSRATLGERRRITVVSSMRSCGSPGRGRLGGICRSVSESGTPFSSDSTDGASMAYGHDSCRLGRIRTLNVSCLTLRSFAPTSTPPGREKRGGRPSPRAFARRIQHQAAHRRRDGGTPGRTDPLAWASPRHDPSLPLAA